MSTIFSRLLDLQFGATVTDSGERIINVAFSSEQPVDQWWGREILDHSPGAVRLDRLLNGAPILYNHERDQLIGAHVPGSIRIDGDRMMRGQIRLVPATEFARDRIAEYDAGLLTKMSVGYRILRIEEEATTADGKKTRRELDGRLFETIFTRSAAHDGDIAAFQRHLDAKFGRIDRAAGDIPTYRVLEWMPVENSLVTLPADDSVGVGRSQPNPPPAGAITPVKGTTTMSDDTQNPAGNQTPATDSRNILENERSRIVDIEALCVAHKIPEAMRATMIRDGISIDAARGFVLDYKLKAGDQKAPNADLGHSFQPDLTPTERNNYSLIRAINAACSGNWKSAGFELECSNFISKALGRGAKVDEGTGVGGFFMPTNIPWYAPQGRIGGYNVGTAGSGTTGGTLVATTLLPGEFIEVLRNQARVLQAGARMLSGLVGNVTIPRQTSASTAYWVAEGGAFTESEGAFDAVTLSIKTLGTRSLITRNMLMQSTPAIEALVRADLIKVLALGIDLAALAGTGTNNQPKGVANLTNVNSVVGGTNGAAITIDHLISMEAAVLDANADFESLAYICNAKTIGSLKSLKATTGSYLWTTAATGARSGTPGEINGYPVFRSNQASKRKTKGTQNGSDTSHYCSEVFFGAWEEILVGEWGVLEILPNPYDPLAYANGGILLRALQSIDIAARHDQSFAYMADAIVLAG